LTISPLRIADNHHSQSRDGTGEAVLLLLRRAQPLRGASGITKMGITELTIAVWPWLLMMLLFLRLVTCWPAMSLWLPHRMVR